MGKSLSRKGLVNRGSGVKVRYVRVEESPAKPFKLPKSSKAIFFGLVLLIIIFAITSTLI